MILLVLAIVLGGSATVFAHAKLVSSEPATGTSVEAPQQAVLEFDSPVERRFAKLTLELPGGAKRTLSPGPTSGLTSQLAVPLGELQPGPHILRWSVVSRDGHRIRGTIKFKVVPTSR